LECGDGDELTIVVGDGLWFVVVYKKDRCPFLGIVFAPPLKPTVTSGRLGSSTKSALLAEWRRLGGIAASEEFEHLRLKMSGDLRVTTPCLF
jgi:hypothetical protein